MSTTELAARKPTQQEIRAEALEQLAILGGKLTAEEDFIFRGKQFIFPENLNLTEVYTVIGERVEEESNDVNYQHTFNYRPMDGARAASLAIKEHAGFALGERIHPFFGRRPPEMIDVRTGPGEHDIEQVPWGPLRIPGMTDVTFHLGSTRHSKLGMVFHIAATGPRSRRYEVQGFFNLVEKYLKTHSIYRGKCIDGGENFIDPYTVDRADVVFTASVENRLNGDLWAFIRHEELLAQLGQDGKFATLLTGDYGGGKSLIGSLTGQECVEHDWTFVMARPGEDDLATVMELALMYQPPVEENGKRGKGGVVLFAEDLDVTAGPDSGNSIERHLDMLDGVRAKGLKLVSVFTTNHPEAIHKGMLRAKRIGAVITIGAMDRAGVEKLGRRVIGHLLDDDTDWDAVFTAVEGYMPAFVREVFDRSVRYAITLNEGKLDAIGTKAIQLAADSLRDQHKLMEGASEERPPTDLTVAFGKAVADVVNKTVVADEDDGYRRYVLIADSNGQ